MSDENGSDRIPYARFAEEIEKRKAAEAAIEEWKGKAAKADKRAAMLETKLDESEARGSRELEALRLEHETSMSMTRAGIDDDDVIDYLRHKYSTLEAGEDGARPAFSDWFTEYRESKPAILRLFEKQETADPPAGDASRVGSLDAVATSRKPADPPPSDPSVNGRVGGAPPPPSSITPDQLLGMSSKEIEERGGIDAIVAGAFSGPTS